jgi:hypothetical protein
MKKLLILSALFLTFATSCKKDSQIEEPTLNGVWYSANPEMQLSIKNTKGEGSIVSYLEFNKDGQRYLQTRWKKDTLDYKVMALTKYSLILRDSADLQINFNKIGD